MNGPTSELESWVVAVVRAALRDKRAEDVAPTAAQAASMIESVRSAVRRMESPTRPLDTPPIPPLPSGISSGLAMQEAELVKQTTAGDLHAIVAAAAQNRIEKDHEQERQLLWRQAVHTSLRGGESGTVAVRDADAVLAAWEERWPR